MTKNILNIKQLPKKNDLDYIEYKIKYGKDEWYCDKDGGGCMPEKYQDTIFEECLINLLNNI